MKKVLLLSFALVMAESVFAGTVYLTSNMDIATKSTFVNGNVAGNNLYFHHGNKGASAQWTTNMYTMSADVTIAASTLAFYCANYQTLFCDFTGRTINLGASGVQFVTHSASAGYGENLDGWLVWKGGTWNYDSGTGEVKLLGRWNTDSYLDDKLHMTVDGAKVKATSSGRTGILMTATKDCDITFTNGAEVDLSNNTLYCFRMRNNASDGVISTGNSIRFEGGTKVKAAKFYADKCQNTDSTGALESGNRIVFAGAGTKLTTTGVVSIGTEIGGNKITIEDGAEIVSGSSLMIANSGNEISLDGGASLTVNGSSFTGRYESGQMGANHTRLLIVDGAVMTVNGQYMTSGTDNAVTISNGTLAVMASSQYAFYTGHSTGDTGHAVDGATFVFRGSHPRLVVSSTADPTVAQVNIQGGSVFRFELPADGHYEETPVEGGNYIVSGSARAVIAGVEAIRANLTEPLTIELLKGYSFSGNPELFFSNLPTGVSMCQTANGYGIMIVPEHHKVVVGGRGYETFEAALLGARHGETIRLLEDVEFDNRTNGAPVCAYNNIGIGGMDFAGIDLDGHNLTWTGSFTCGESQYGRAVYGKRITVPKGSTLDFASAQVKFYGDNVIVLEGVMKSAANAYAFSFRDTEIDFIGKDALLKASGSEGRIHSYNCVFEFDLVGANLLYETAPIVIESATGVNSSGFGFGNTNTIRFKNTAAVTKGISAVTDVPLVASPLVTDFAPRTVLPEGFSTSREDAAYVLSFEKWQVTVDRRDVSFLPGSQFVTTRFGGARPTAADLQTVESNGLKTWENYVLGLDGSDANDRPLVNSRVASAPEKMALGVDNVEVNETSEVGVVFSLKSATAAEGPYGTVDSNETGEFEFNLPAEKAKFYRIGYDFE